MKHTKKLIMLAASISLVLSCKTSVEEQAPELVQITSGSYDGTTVLNPPSEVFIEGRSITIPSLYVCAHEVTQKEYGTYCALDDEDFLEFDEDKGDNYPMYYVSWYDALVYCNKRSLAEKLTPCYSISGKTNPSEWGAVPDETDAVWEAATCDFTANGYRLPTEAEWEYCARGGNKDSYKYSGSDDLDEVAWYEGNCDHKLHEVKQKKPNSLGLYDMSGNLWEWCWDFYGSISSDTDSSGPSSGENRVLRGGSCQFSASGKFCEVAARYSRPAYRNSCPDGHFTFRVVRTLANE